MNKGDNSKCLWRHIRRIFERFKGDMWEYIRGRYIISQRRITVVFSVSSKVSSKEPRSSKRNSRRRIHKDPSLIDGRQVDSYSRPKEIPSSMEANIPSSIRSIYYRVHVLYWSAHDIWSRSIAFAEHAEWRDRCLTLNITRERIIFLIKGYK